MSESYNTDRLPRVLFVISNLDRAGGQLGMQDLALSLSARGCFSAVCAFRDGPLRAELEQHGVPVHIVPDRRADFVALPWFPRELVRIRNALRGLIREYQIDVIQAHLLRSLDFLVLTLRREPGVRHVFWVFDNVRWELERDALPRHRWLLRPKRAVFRSLYRGAAPHVSGFIAVSDQVAEALERGLGPLRNQLHIVPNGVSIKRFALARDRRVLRRELGLDPDAVYANVTARLVLQKGHRWFIEAASPLFQQFPNLYVLFVGDGELRGQLTAQARQAGLAERIRFLGERTDIPQLLASSDFFVLPSLWEGMSFALLEALASELPVIATNVSGARQVIRDGIDGLLIEPGDGAALRVAMTSLLSNAARARDLARAGRQRVEYFTSERRTRQYFELYCAPAHKTR